MRVQNLRVSAIGKRPAFDLSAMAPCASNTIDDAVSGRREVWDAGQWRLANVYDRLALPVGATLHGPALFEQDDATVFLDTGFTATVDALGNLLITPDDA